MKGQSNRWFRLAQQREQERALLLRANKILRADQRQKLLEQQSQDSRQFFKASTKSAAVAPPAAKPQRYTLSDLGLLRRQGRVP
jgi:hypothetical protein